MLSYQDLYEYVRKEKNSEPLQQLTSDFIVQVSSYLQEQQNQSAIDGTSFLESADKSKKQFENSKALFKELMLRRKKKLLNLVFVATETGIMKRDYENMLPFERELFDKVVHFFEEGSTELSKQLYRKTENEQVQQAMIIFHQDIEQFVDLSGKVVGPFRAGELAHLDKEVADILVSSGKARTIDGT